jgi:hypothetical protein
MTHALKERLERLADESRPVGATALMERVERQLTGAPTTGLVARPAAKRPMLAYVAAFVAVLLVGSFTWIGLTRSDEPSSPADGGPVDRWGLAAVDLPDTEGEIAAVFQSMPAELDGLPVVGDRSDGHGAAYGERGNEEVYAGYATSEHRVMPDGTVTSPAEWLTLMATAPEFDVIGYVVDEPVVWLYATYAARDGSPDAGHMLEVGDADGEFLFAFGAPTGAELDAIVAAFIDTTERLAAGE